MSAPPLDDALERALERSAGSAAIPGNAVELLYDGPVIYPEMHRMIESAERRIHFENYIFRDDACGQEFANRLIERAQAGVRVRVLYDWLGSFSTSARFWQKLRQGGVEVQAFGAPRLRDPLAIISRDHRKAMIVDGKAAVTGGHCIGDEWTGNINKGQQPWRDTAVSIRGPAARAVDNSFVRVWAEAGGDPIDDAVELESEVAEAGDLAVRVIATRPGEERAWRTINLMLGVGADRIWLTEAYLAGPQRIFQVFEDAASDGVDVRLLVPGASDLPMVRNLSRTGYRRLLRSGVRIWEWGGPMLHAKAICIDGRWVRVGSSNFNPSSLTANYELDVLIDDRRMAQQFDQQFLEDLSRSGEVLTRPRKYVSMLPRVGLNALITEAPPLGRLAHKPGGRERRSRAVLQAAVLGRAARAALLGPLALVLAAFAAFLVIFPRFAAYSTALLSVLLSIALFIRAQARRPRSRKAPG